MNDNKSVPRKCNQCGSDLILVDQKSERLGNHFSLMQTNVYHCSNQVCQEEIDKKIAHRLEIRQDPKLAHRRAGSTPSSTSVK